MTQTFTLTNSVRHYGVCQTMRNSASASFNAIATPETRAYISGQIDTVLWALHIRKPFRFFGLPLELRYMIYEEIFASITGPEEATDAMRVLDAGDVLRREALPALIARVESLESDDEVSDYWLINVERG